VGVVPYRGHPRVARVAQSGDTMRGMTAVVCTVDIERPPSQVFDYVTDPSRFGEWQKGVVSGHVNGDPAVGSTCTMTRKIGGSERTSTSEIITYDPPRAWAIHGIDGPIRADVQVQVEALPQAQHSRVTIQLDFSGHGLGKLLAPLVIGQARKEVPVSCQNLKGILERSA
jgi:carbon monoxide dehydrogenase subunit G